MASKTFYECGCMEHGDQWFSCAAHATGVPRGEEPHDGETRGRGDFGAAVDHRAVVDGGDDPLTQTVAPGRSLRSALQQIVEEWRKDANESWALASGAYIDIDRCADQLADLLAAYPEA